MILIDILTDYEDHMDIEINVPVLCAHDKQYLKQVHCLEPVHKVAVRDNGYSIWTCRKAY